jgi:hypothetical protein
MKAESFRQNPCVPPAPAPAPGRGKNMIHSYLLPTRHRSERWEYLWFIRMQLMELKGRGSHLDYYPP